MFTWQSEKSAVFCHISKIVRMREICWVKVNFLITVVGLREGLFHPKKWTCVGNINLPDVTETKAGSHAISYPLQSQKWEKGRVPVLKESGFRNFLSRELLLFLIA